MPLIYNNFWRFGCAIAILAAMPTLAENEDTITRCARIGSVGERILCLEDALRGSSNEVAATPSEADLMATPAVENMASPLFESDVPSLAAEATSISPDDASVANEIFGLKDKQPPKAANTIQVIVAAVRKNLSNKFVFETGDGQVWVQTDRRTVRYEDTPFSAEIRAASLGSFFLKPASGGVAVRVRREK